MSTSLEYPHLTRHADGTVRIGNTRYKVLHLAGEHYYHGWSAEEIRRTLRAAGFDRVQAWDAAPFFTGDSLIRPGCRTVYLARKTRLV